MFQLFIFIFAIVFLPHIQAKQASLPESIQYFGRFDFSNGYPVADWSGSRLTFLVDGWGEKAEVSLSVIMGGEIESYEYYVGVEINCNLVGRYGITPFTPYLNFSFDADTDSIYEVSVIKLTEASTGAMAFNSLTVDHASLSKSTTAAIVDKRASSGCSRYGDRKLKMLVLGDSITAAYGVDGVYPCSYSPDTENILESYASLVATSVNAQLHTVAWSGKGVVRNYGDENSVSANPLPIYYNRTLGISADPALYWDPATTAYVPDIILITLGSNDYSTQPNPSDEDFTAGYTALVTQLQKDYPLALIAAVCEPTPGNGECENEQRVAECMGLSIITVPDSIYVNPNGCDGHPSVQGQQNIAAVVTPAVIEMLSAARNKT